ncbi:MAG: hypothetical protein AB7E81_10455, partial [Hyphomicrobiaceae bacterium]
SVFWWRMALLSSVFDEAGKLANHRRISAMRPVHQNSTGQHCACREDPSGSKREGVTLIEASKSRPFTDAAATGADPSKRKNGSSRQARG